MGLFGKKEDKPAKTEGGLMDMIRCDESDYLIWKWQPAGATDTTKKENAIRWGSSLRVKDGEVAVFVYKQKTGQMQDFIEGPYDETLKTANFPVLASIMGAAFGGGTPFQAEVYFINTAGIIQIKFAVPYFDVFDPRFLDYAVPVAVRGSMTFKITDYKEFIKLHRLVSFDLEQFKSQIQDAVKKYVKSVVSNAPSDNGIPLVQMDRKILQINELIEEYIKPRMQNDFGVTVSAVDIGEIDIDKTSEGYKELMSVTKDFTTQNLKTQQNINIDSMNTQHNLQMQNLKDTQRINTQNMEDTLRRQREEMQYAQHMQTDTANFAMNQLKAQKDVAMAGAAAFGKLGESGAMNVNTGGSMNPAGMMAGMAMGGQIAQGMSQMMGTMMGGQALNQQVMPGMVPGQMTPPPTGGMMPPPPPAGSMYNVAVNGQSTGPYDFATLQQMASNGQLTAQSQVWKTGMASWQAAVQVSELAGLFAPPAPSAPPVPPPVN